MSSSGNSSKSLAGLFTTATNWHRFGIPPASSLILLARAEAVRRPSLRRSRSNSTSVWCTSALTICSVNGWATLRDRPETFRKARQTAPSLVVIDDFDQVLAADNDRFSTLLTDFDTREHELSHGGATGDAIVLAITLRTLAKGHPLLGEFDQHSCATPVD